jgi:hypothetical protein
VLPHCNRQTRAHTVQRIVRKSLLVKRGRGIRVCSDWHTDLRACRVALGFVTGNPAQNTFMLAAAIFVVHVITLSGGSMRFLIRQRPLLAGSALAIALTLVPASAQQAETIDLDAIYKIKEEGFARSRVMEIMSWLTDVYGPRLTNSPGFRKAGDWAVKEMTSWGLVNVKLQPFGPFGRGWSNEKFYMMATTPGGSFPVIGYPQAWTSGTAGVASGDAVLVTIDTAEDLGSWKSPRCCRSSTPLRSG